MLTCAIPMTHHLIPMTHNAEGSAPGTMGLASTHYHPSLPPHHRRPRTSASFTSTTRKVASTTVTGNQALQASRYVLKKKLASKKKKKDTKPRLPPAFYLVAPRMCSKLLHGMLTCVILMTACNAGPVLPLYEAAVGAKLTLEACGAACYKSNPSNGIGGVLGGNQCFCGNDADLSSAAAKARSLASRALCETKPCVGDPAREPGCGGANTMLAYAYTCDGANAGDINIAEQEKVPLQEETTLIDTDKTCFSCFRIPTLLAGLAPGVVHAFAEGQWHLMMTRPLRFWWSTRGH